MPTTLVVSEYAAMYSQGGTIAVPRLPEIKTTDVDTGSTTSLVLDNSTAFVVLQAVAGQGARRFSGRAAIGGGNVGMLVEDGTLYPAHVKPGMTLYFG